MIMIQDLVKIENLSFSYHSPAARKGSWYLKVEHLAIQAGTLVQIRGENMAGKTTLLRLLAGLERFTIGKDTRVSGSLLKSDGHRSGATVKLRLRDTCLLSNTDHMFPELTLWENVLLARSCGSETPRSEGKLRFKGFASTSKALQDKPNEARLGSLSSGAQSLVKLARPFTWKAKLILIDEISANLDEENAATFFNHLREFLKQQTSVVFVSHVERHHELASQLAQQANARSHILFVRSKENISCVTEHSSSS
jgi:ribose transport system ATP-binding protein